MDKISNTLTNILNKQLGENVPLNKRTKWTQEFTGLTIRNWLMIPVRAVIMLPLLAITKILTYIAAFTDSAFDAVDKNLR